MSRLEIIRNRAANGMFLASDAHHLLRRVDAAEKALRAIVDIDARTNREWDIRTRACNYFEWLAEQEKSS